MSTLELLIASAPRHIREKAFRIAFPDENKAAFLLAKLLAEEAGTTMDINHAKAADMLGVSPRTIHNWLRDVSCNELLGRKKKDVK